MAWSYYRSLSSVLTRTVALVNIATARKREEITLSYLLIFIPSVWLLLRNQLRLLITCLVIPLGQVHLLVKFVSAISSTEIKKLLNCWRGIGSQTQGSISFSCEARLQSLTLCIRQNHHNADSSILSTQCWPVVVVTTSVCSLDTRPDRSQCFDTLAKTNMC